jgi:hypothetical protein
MNNTHLSRSITGTFSIEQMQADSSSGQVLQLNAAVALELSINQTRRE